MPEPAAPELADGTRVLVVDDDASIRELLDVALTLRGLNVRALSSLDEARAALAAGGVDVVLVDDSLGGVAVGAAFLHELKTLAPGVGRVLMTGAPEADAAALGCDLECASPSCSTGWWRRCGAR